jgi:hypothetical protein
VTPRERLAARRRRAALAVVPLMGIVSLPGCAGRPEGFATAAEWKEAPAQREGGDDSSARLLVRTASSTVAVASVPDAVAQAESIVGSLGGRVERSRVSKDQPAQLDLRVPADGLSQALDRFAALGEERQRNTSSADVTDEVGDAEAELANQRALIERLRALLGRAKDVKEVLAVEHELTRIQTQIDTLEGRLQRLRGEIALSAVDLTLMEKEPEKKPRIYGPLGYLWIGSKWFVTKLFVIRE